MAMESGESILKVTNFMRDFYEKVGLLLQDADRLMGKRSWECTHGNLCRCRVGKGVEHPSAWLPDGAFRFYMQEQKESNTLVCIAALLSDSANEFKNFREPLITANCWTFEDKASYDEINKQKGAWWYGWYDTNGALDEWHDGRFIRVPRSAMTEAEGYEFEEEHPLFEEGTFGYPLVQFASAADLEKKIVEPLMDLVKKMEAGRRSLMPGKTT